MRSTVKWPLGAGLVVLFVAISGAPAEQDVAAQGRTAFSITRLYTGPDKQSHAEDIAVAFNQGPTSNIAPLMKITGAELHRTPPGRFNDWHPGPRRQYVITLSGRGEIEVAGGKKIALEPGHIELIEDTTGKGHTTRVIGNEERVTLWLPIADQSTR
ncbi:MAG: hypothetical protein HY824_01030 [Acidobacteria bacterium]|nr:hypothetical protein [Acidobacteriota bacterium]